MGAGNLSLFLYLWQLCCTNYSKARDAHADLNIRSTACDSTGTSSSFLGDPDPLMAGVAKPSGRAKLIGWLQPTVQGDVCCDWPTASWRYANSSGRYISCRAPPENLSSLFLADFGIPSQTLIPPPIATPRLSPTPLLSAPSASHKFFF